MNKGVTLEAQNMVLELNSIVICRPEMVFPFFFFFFETKGTLVLKENFSQRLLN